MFVDSAGQSYMPWGGDWHRLSNALKKQKLISLRLVHIIEKVLEIWSISCQDARRCSGGNRWKAKAKIICRWKGLVSCKNIVKMVNRGRTLWVWDANREGKDIEIRDEREDSHMLSRKSMCRGEHKTLLNLMMRRWGGKTVDRPKVHPVATPTSLRCSQDEIKLIKALTEKTWKALFRRAAKVWVIVFVMLVISLCYIRNEILSSVRKRW